MICQAGSFDCGHFGTTFFFSLFGVVGEGGVAYCPAIDCHCQQFPVMGLVVQRHRRKGILLIAVPLSHANLLLMS
jgi:hypothetical protein